MHTNVYHATRNAIIQTFQNEKQNIDEKEIISPEFLLPMSDLQTVNNDMQIDGNDNVLKRSIQSVLSDTRDVNEEDLQNVKNSSRALLGSYYSKKLFLLETYSSINDIIDHYPEDYQRILQNISDPTRQQEVQKFLPKILVPIQKIEIQNRKNFVTIANNAQGVPTDKGVHAEVKIAQELKNRAGTDQITPPYNIDLDLGISKLSCATCWFVLEAFKDIGIKLNGPGTHGKPYQCSNFKGVDSNVLSEAAHKMIRVVKEEVQIRTIRNRITKNCYHVRIYPSMPESSTLTSICINRNENRIRTKKMTQELFQILRLYLENQYGIRGNRRERTYNATQLPHTNQNHRGI
ncbi:MAG: hypothetical protein ISN64_02255 [Rickettsia sp.]|nr:hypothetical protein [Rickettsia sp.]